jgi:hypothetical protein
MPADITVGPGQIVRQLTRLEISESVGRWLDCFGKDRFGVNARAYMWHVFSYERYPSLSGQAAQREYEQHEAPEFWVVSNERDEGFVTDLLPQSCSLRDWIVFPVNLAWTMVFTHEDGYLGPYFARSPAYASLNAENQTRVGKARSAARARDMGWS